MDSDNKVPVLIDPDEILYWPQWLKHRMGLPFTDGLDFRKSDRIGQLEIQLHEQRKLALQSIGELQGIIQELRYKLKEKEELIEKLYKEQSRI